MRQLAKEPGSKVSKLPLKPGTNDPKVPSIIGAECLANFIAMGTHHGQDTWLIDNFPRRGEPGEDNVGDWLKFMKPADLLIHLTCPVEISMRRIARSADKSGRPEDASAATMRERLLQIEHECDNLMRTLRNTHSPILMLKTDRPMWTIKAELSSQVRVSYGPPTALRC